MEFNTSLHQNDHPDDGDDKEHLHHHCHYPFSSPPPAGCRRGIIKRSRARQRVEQLHNTHKHISCKRTQSHTQIITWKDKHVCTVIHTNTYTHRRTIWRQKYKSHSTNYRAESQKRSLSTISCTIKANAQYVWYQVCKRYDHPVRYMEGTFRVNRVLRYVKHVQPSATL